MNRSDVIDTNSWIRVRYALSCFNEEGIFQNLNKLFLISSSTIHFECKNYNGELGTVQISESSLLGPAFTVVAFSTGPELPDASSRCINPFINRFGIVLRKHNSAPDVRAEEERSTLSGLKAYVQIPKVSAMSLQREEKE
ncbi:unnamed protein product [Acanthoscelides obtectus]|uniref:Uncharacterized protein n=1 Tax=Acanthoscelides obtectus TaxID=200917 RepID=A0A9P0Q0K8_ACAOB|nr:unnamed protein product [Acanthoscelides obtectus]CAK1674645.1 hypothetical protein AOBTE_LOCUS29691 [Acanthoscelides obtectus]